MGKRYFLVLFFCVLVFGFISKVYANEPKVERSELNEIVIDDRLFIDDEEFMDMEITHITIPPAVTDIGVRAFKNNFLREVIIPNSVVVIRQSAFENNELESISLSNDLFRVSARAFADNKLTSINLKHTTEVHREAFANNEITQIAVGSDVNMHLSAFEFGFTVFYRENDRRAGTYTFADGVWTWVSFSGDFVGVSIDDFAHLEPEMAPNPSRVETRTGEVAEVGIPDYLRPVAGSPATTTARFSIHPNDRDFAEIVWQDEHSCKVKGLRLGSARIIITVGGQSATVVIAVSPYEDLYTVPITMVKRLGDSEFQDTWWRNDRPDELPPDYAEYTADPTAQLAWKWRNPPGNFGASGMNCGFDILGYYVDPGVPNRGGWVRTTYGFGGWHYDLNGQTNQMVNGVQVNGNVRLELKPEFIYDKGKPYLQITHTLTNTGSTPLIDQKFGASADIMIFNQDAAPLSSMTYGALMTNAHTYNGIDYLPTIKLRLVCQNLYGLTDASTMWIGAYGNERQFIYVDRRNDLSGVDSALNFSYQNIRLEPGESKHFVIRFTQVQ